MKRIVPAAAALLFLSGCGKTVQQTDNSLADLDYRFYPIEEQYGLKQPDAALLQRLRSGYDAVLDARRAQLTALMPPSPAEPVNRVPEDPVLPVSRFSPMTKLLYADDFILTTNPVLIMRQILTGMPDGAVQESDTQQKEEKIPLAGVPAASYDSSNALIASGLQQYYYNMPYEIGFSDWENLYYVYLFDTREQLSVMALYFRFDDANRLIGVGADSLFYNPYEITMQEDGQYLPLAMPSDPTALPPLQHIREMALANLGSVLPGGNASAAAQPDSTDCTHKQELQYYYNQEPDDARLLAVRTMDWYLLEPETPPETTTTTTETTAAATTVTTVTETVPVTEPPATDPPPPPVTIPTLPDPAAVVTEIVDDLISALPEILP